MSYRACNRGMWQPKLHNWEDLGFKGDRMFLQVSRAGLETFTYVMSVAAQFAWRADVHQVVYYTPQNHGKKKLY